MAVCGANVDGATCAAARAVNIQPRHAGRNGRSDRRRPQCATSGRKGSVPTFDDPHCLLMGCLVGRAGAPVGSEAICASWLVLGHGVVSAGGKEGATNQAVRAKQHLDAFQPARRRQEGGGQRKGSCVRHSAGAGAPRRCPRTENLLKIWTTQAKRLNRRLCPTSSAQRTTTRGGRRVTLTASAAVDNPSATTMALATWQSQLPRPRGCANGLDRVHLEPRA